MKHFLPLMLLLAGTAVAQSPPATDEIAQNLIPPEIIIKYRQDIGLDDAQSKSLKDLVQAAQGKLLEMQWDTQTEAGKLAQLLKSPHIDENAALAQANKVIGMEQEVKRTHLLLLIHLKNLLTPAQQNKLLELRRQNP
jgi:Spy/CpxP family protein refolding chaperone